MKRGKLLTDALKTITGDRQDIYGSPEDSFSEIAYRWTRLLRCRGVLAQDKEITRDVAAFMMVEFKMARECVSPKRDNLLDICGYSAIVADILACDEEKPFDFIPGGHTPYEPDWGEIFIP